MAVAAAAAVGAGAATTAETRLAGVLMQQLQEEVQAWQLVVEEQLLPTAGSHMASAPVDICCDAARFEHCCCKAVDVLSSCRRLAVATEVSLTRYTVSGLPVSKPLLAACQVTTNRVQLGLVGSNDLRY